MRISHIAIVIIGTLLLLGNSQAAKISDIANTQHNLSMTWGGEGADPRSVTATAESQICVFCHTPHGANTTTTAPLWNRSLEGDIGYSATYSMYNSSSMEASQLAGAPPTAPSNSSKLCLSCHDGVIAVGSVNVLNGSSGTIAMNNTGTGGVMPDGSYGANSGNTRNIGTDLTNDHPISITYNSALALADGELTDPLASPHVGVRGPGLRPLIPLIPDPEDGNTPKLECVSCHDPHIRDDTGTDIKFLRLNRFQANNDPVGQGGNANLVNFNENNDIICLACHNKEGWVDSAHASEQVANETYNTTAASERDFPAGIQVWQAACLNCHDTHTVAGSRRLLREGTSDVPPNGQVIKAGGGSPAIEETCYQCHANSAEPYYVLDGSNPQVPDIKSDFQLARHMPITSSEQLAGAEVHDIGNTGNSGDGKEMIETQLTLGKGNPMNRHAECTDCHNPHRVTKNRLATDAPSTPSAAGTHDHNLTESSEHSNLISGVLRGTWGVEPNYGASPFGTLPISYTLKSGVPPQNGSNLVTEAYVTREYQVCLKCHSDYGFDDANPPALGYYMGGTPSGTNGMIYYTDQAMEFQAPNHHQGSPVLTTDSGAYSGEVSTYKYYDYAWEYNVWEIEWQWSPSLAFSNTSEDCDGWGSDLPGCVCETCTGLDITYGSDGTVASTCGIDDVSKFASTGLPGFSESPWDGTAWSGSTTTPPVPYSALRCTKTVNFSDNNHRSWHPVMKPTGRTAAVRDLNGDTAAFLPPWNAGVGTQSMYCSDCHGSGTQAGTAVPDGGEDGSPWGPHGSNNNFLLKGGWDVWTGSNDPNALCFKCHDYDAYGNPDPPVDMKSGFSKATGGYLCGPGGSDTGVNLHTAHSNLYVPGRMGRPFRCSACHVAVPHGWKNKALLVNLSDVGPEAGLPPGTEITDDQLPFTSAPYYLGALNYIYNFKPSGQWTVNDCGSANDSGLSAMVSVCNNVP